MRTFRNSPRGGCFCVNAAVWNYAISCLIIYMGAIDPHPCVRIAGALTRMGARIRERRYARARIKRCLD